MSRARRLEEKLEGLVPPGTDVWREVKAYLIALGSCTLASLHTLGSIYQAWRGLYGYVEMETPAGRKSIYTLTDALMPTFFSLCGVLPFMAAAMLVVCGLGVIAHRSAFTRETNALYLMRRLPTRGELFYRTWLLPIIGVLAAAAVFAVLYVCYYFFYLNITPKGHLPI